MSDFGKGPTKGGLDAVGIKTKGNVYWNLDPAALVELAIRRGEGEFAHNGALVTRTGERTGRSPNDRFIVREPSSEGKIAWGNVNRPMEPEVFDRMHQKLAAHLSDKDLFVQDLWGGADPSYRLPIRVISQDAWHSVFARQLFVRDDLDARFQTEPAFTVINGWKLKAKGKDDGLQSEVFVLMNLAKRVVLIGGTGYAGEMKKSIFAVLNYILPQKGVLSMHCSANV
ncbi:MAG: phosphoenolpyruvate carboxykinase (ATP), partial [Myxococcales bacterium]|nr:phosphoenolpyruvate carboxykinase (ATP) [Myxococcales bacterium]